MSDIQGGAPAGQDTGASDGGFDFDSIDSFEMIDGSLQPVFGEAEEPAADAATETTTETKTAETPAPDTAATPEAGHDWEKRYSDLRPAFDRVTQDNARMRRELDYLKGQIDAALGSGRKQEEKTEQPEDEVDYYDLMADPKRARAHFDSMVERAVQQRLAAYEPHFVEMELASELRGVVGKYPDFISMQPYIHQVFEVFPNTDISFEQAYHIAKRFFPSATAQPQHDAGKPDPKPDAKKVDMARLKERAARVNPETGVGGPAVDDQPKQEANDLEEAFNMALRSLSGRR